MLIEDSYSSSILTNQINLRCWPTLSQLVECIANQKFKIPSFYCSNFQVKHHDDIIQYSKHVHQIELCVLLLSSPLELGNQRFIVPHVFLLSSFLYSINSAAIFSGSLQERFFGGLIQTIRNNIMAPTLLATTVITLCSLIGIFASSMDF